VIEGMDADLVHILSEKGITSQEGLADLSTDELVELAGIDTERANKLITKAREPWFT